MRSGVLMSKRCHAILSRPVAAFQSPASSVDRVSCSATSGDFLVPAFSTQTIGPRAFAVSWNSLPPDVRVPGISLATFKKKLKTFSVH